MTRPDFAGLLDMQKNLNQMAKMFKKQNVS